MINLPGELSIRTIQGSRGAFNVGRLITSIGEFVVKEALLDQYYEGKYSGDFVITQIKPSTYTAAGRLVVEIRAMLQSMSLDEADDLTEADNERLPQNEIDPLDEDAISPAAAPTVVAPAQHTPSSEQSFPASNDDDSLEKDEQLFSTLWPLGAAVKLDTTVSRLVLRDQCRRLKELGYEHDFKSQLWTLSPEM